MGTYFLIIFFPLHELRKTWSRAGLWVLQVQSIPGRWHPGLQGVGVGVGVGCRVIA